MKKLFVSPQTGSKFALANCDDALFVSFRPIEDSYYRVRIQGSKQALDQVKKHLPSKWSAVKGGDHVSYVTKGDERLANCIADAVRAVTIVAGPATLYEKVVDSTSNALKY